MIDTPEEKRLFECLYLLHKQTMYYVAFRILEDEHEAEDAVHQAFLRVIDHLEKIDEAESQRTRGYLVAIVENVSIDIYRKRKRTYVDVDSLLIDRIDSGASCDFDERDGIRQAFNRLPIQYATILKLRFSQGYTDEEIAALLNTSAINVRQRISRGRKKLQKFLEEEGVTL